MNDIEKIDKLKAIVNETHEISIDLSEEIELLNFLFSDPEVMYDLIRNEENMSNVSPILYGVKRAVQRLAEINKTITYNLDIPII